MIGQRRVLAIVPARRGSKGLPLKNIRLLNGKPLLAWPIKAALGSAFVDRVIISTDDAEFAAIARRHGADAPFLRPANLALDETPSIDFILHAIQTLEAQGETYDYIVLLEPTSPLTEASDVDAALTTLHESEGRAEAIVGVATLVATHPAYAVRRLGGGLIAPYLADGFANLPRRQDTEPLFCLDGSLYISTVGALKRERSFCHERTLAYETAPHKALEVDHLIDFICIEAIAQNLDIILNNDRPSPDSSAR